MRQIYYNQYMFVRLFNGKKSIMIDSRQGIPRRAQKGEWYVFKNVNGKLYVPKGDPILNKDGSMRKGEITDNGYTYTQKGGKKPSLKLKWGRTEKL